MALVDHDAGPELEPLDRRLEPRDLLLLRRVVLLLPAQRDLLLHHEGGVVALPDRESRAARDRLEIRDPLDRVVEEIPIVRDDHDRALEFADEPLERLLALEIQMVVRLIQQQEIRVRDQAGGDPDELSLSAGQGRQRQLPMRSWDAELPQQTLRAIAEPWSSGPLERMQQSLLPIEDLPEPRHVTGKGWIGELLPHGGEVAIDGRDVRPGVQQHREHRSRRSLLFLREIGHAHVAGARDEPALGRLEPRDRAQERRLPAAVRTDEPDASARFDRPREVREDRAVAVRACDCREIGDDHAAI